MFGTETPAGLRAGEIRENDSWFDAAFDDLVHRLTSEAIDEGWEATDPHQLPHGFDLIPPGSLLSAALSRTDRSHLNGHDLVRTMQARERQISHYQAGSMADAVEISHSAPGDASSPAKRIEEASEFASDEIRAALSLTRRSADLRLSDATDVRERLPKVWAMLDDGLIDLSRARVIAQGTSHLPDDIAREVTDNDGRVVHTGITRRRPTAAQTRHVQSLHPTCTFPGCRVQGEDCDLDHEVPWAKGGPTTVENLGPKCRHDHRLKDHGWSHRFEDGQNIWTSPMGHTYIINGQSP